MPLKDYSRVLNISNQCCVHLGEYQEKQISNKKKKDFFYFGGL